MSPPTARRAAGWMALVAGSALWIAGLGAFPLLESTEGRYASIAAEMARGGSLLEPRFDGLLHLDKPPLAYWLGAVLLRVWPRSELAVRLPALLAWLCAAWLVGRLAGAAGLDRRRARWAAALAALAPFAVVQARMLSSDIFLWPAVVGVYWGLTTQSPPDWRRPAAVGLCLGLGMLAKGHMILFWTVLPALLEAAVTRSGRRLRILFHPLALTGFVVVGLSWFLLEAARRPGLVSFWLGRETAGRFLGSSHGRHGPWWYFLPLLPLAVLPWLPEVLRGTVGAVRCLRAQGQFAAESSPGGRWPLSAATTRLLLAWIALPLALLSMSGSKRANYLLPAVAPFAVLAAAVVPERAPRGLKLRLAIWGGACSLAPFVMGAVPAFVPPTRMLAAAAAAHGGPLIAYGALPSSLPFYAGSNVPTVGVGRMSGLDPDTDVERWAPTSDEALIATLDAGGSILARCAAREQLEQSLRRQLQVRASLGRMCLVGADQAIGSPPPRP